MDDKNERIDFCVVENQPALKIWGYDKNRKKRFTTGYFSILGKQGHSAYPHLAINPIHASVKLIIC